MRKSIATTSGPGTRERQSPAGNAEEFTQVDWFLANVVAKFNLYQEDKVIRDTGFVGFVWPVGLPYCSPFNGIFLAEVIGLEALNSQPLWLARDGIIPLSWFFRKFPEPGKFSQKILVHEEFAPFVPKPWRKRVGTYRIQSLGAKKSNGEKLFMTALLAPYHSSITHLESCLDRLRDHFGGPVFEKMEKEALLLERHAAPGFNRFDSYMCEFLFRVGRVTPGLSPVRAMNWQNFEERTHFGDTCVFEINEKLIYADSHVVHSALQRGGRFLDLNAPKYSNEKGRFVRLSPYHGFFIREALPGKFMESLREPQSNLSALYEKIMFSDANLKLPWPDWIAAWKNKD